MKYKPSNITHLIPIFLVLLTFVNCSIFKDNSIIPRKDSDVSIIFRKDRDVNDFGYYNGNLMKIYQSEYYMTTKAITEVLKDSNIRILEEIGSQKNKIISAKHTDGTPITLAIVRMESNLTEISVRSGEMGSWEKQISEKIHEAIAVRLNQFAKNELKSSDNSDLQTSQRKPSSNNRDNEKPDVIIFFTPDSNKLSAEAIEKLNRVAQSSISETTSKIMVTGFTDSTGTSTYNKIVAESRAAAVKLYLVGKGVNPSKIVIEGRGAANFLGNNKSEEGRKLNRRVELKILK